MVPYFSSFLLFSSSKNLRLFSLFTMSDGVIRLAVFGKTGAGKSSFVSSATGCEFEIGHSGSSCESLEVKTIKARCVISNMMHNLGTSEVSHGEFFLGKTRVIIFDTPGFDDSDSKDPQIFEKLTKWLAASHKAGKYLNGLIFMQPISETRITGSEKKRTQLFKKIVGENFYCQVALVTSMWDFTREEKGNAHENHRVDDPTVWGDMLQGGAQVLRFLNTPESALEIVKYFTDRPSRFPPKPTQLQLELQSAHGRVEDTSAFQKLDSDLGQKISVLQQNSNAVGGNTKLDQQVQEITRWRSRLKRMVVSGCPLIYWCFFC